MRIDPSSAKLLGMSPCTVIHAPSGNIIPMVLWIDTDDKVYACAPLTVIGDYIQPTLHEYKSIRLDVESKIIYIDPESEANGCELVGGEVSKGFPS